MSAVGFTIPQLQDVPTHQAQTVEDRCDLLALRDGTFRTGVCSGLTVTPKTPASSKVAVAAGRVVEQGGVASATIAAAATLTLTNGTSGRDRRDIVVAYYAGTTAGTVKVVKGTPCTATGWTTGHGTPPVKPQVPSTAVLVYEVYRKGGATTVVTGDLVDKRVMVPGLLWVPQSANLWEPPVMARTIPTGYHPRGVLKAVKLEVKATRAYNAIGYNIQQVQSTPTGNVTLRAGIYRDNGAGFPGKLLADFGVQGAISTGSKTHTFTALTLTPDTYWLTTVRQGTNTTTGGFTKGLVLRTVTRETFVHYFLGTTTPGYLEPTAPTAAVDAMGVWFSTATGIFTASTMVFGALPSDWTGFKHAGLSTQSDTYVCQLRTA